MCLSVKSHFTSGASVRPENTVVYSVGNGGQNICGVFSETAPLQRSSTSPLKAIHTVSHFPADSVHAHCGIFHVVAPRFCTLVHSLRSARSNIFDNMELNLSPVANFQELVYSSGCNMC